MYIDRGTHAVRPNDTIFLINRCRRCSRLVTKLEILHNFKEQIPQLCPCGSRSISPGNATPEEYKTLGGKKQEKRWKAGIDDEGTRLWKLWDAYQKGEVHQPEPEPVAEPSTEVKVEPPVEVDNDVA